MRKKVAIFTHGGIGTGSNSQGFPMITQIVDRLSVDFDITIYSLSTFNDHFESVKFKAYDVPKSIKPLFLRWIYLTVSFVLHTFRNKYDVLYSFWGYPTGLLVVILGKLYNKPSLVNILGAETASIPELKYGYLVNPRTKKRVLWTCKHADRLIAVSQYQVESLRKHGLRRDIDVIPWGADCQQFFCVFHPLSPPLKILHVANLTWIKDQDTLLQAFKIVRNKIPAVLKIVGPDFLNGRIQALAETIGISDDVEFVGFVPYNQILTYFHWADMFLLTSLSEGQNNSITEAMMCGILPVGTSVGIMHDIGEQVGIVANCKDYKTLADKVIDLYQSPVAWDRKRKAAHQWATTHDLNWTIAQLKIVLSN